MWRRERRLLILPLAQMAAAREQPEVHNQQQEEPAAFSMEQG